jgi:hypothetical protein
MSDEAYILGAAFGFATHKCYMCHQEANCMRRLIGKKHRNPDHPAFSERPDEWTPAIVPLCETCDEEAAKHQYLFAHSSSTARY